jgi:hypothetical protein
MALSELEIRHCEKLVAEFIERRRPSPQMRAQVDLAFRISGQSIEIFTIRPDWRDDSKTVEEPVAKATYNKKKAGWKVFWQRADMKWHGYETSPTLVSVEQFLEIVQTDEYGCFFG